MTSVLHAFPQSVRETGVIMDCAEEKLHFLPVQSSGGLAQISSLHYICAWADESALLRINKSCGAACGVSSAAIPWRKSVMKERQKKPRFSHTFFVCLFFL